MSACKDLEGKCTVKWQGGDGVKEGSQDPSSNGQHPKEPPGGGSQGIKPPPQTTFLNPDPFQCWHEAENIARVRINGKTCIALLDNGAQINTITPKYLSDHWLQVGPITNILGTKVAYIGLGNAYTRPLGYVIIWVQVDGFQGYDEDQIALVIPDVSNYAARVPIILGTPPISCIVNVMKEKEIDTLATPWANARVAHFLLVCRMTTVKVGDGAAEECGPANYDQVMFTQNIETIEAFSSHIVLVKVGKAYTGGCINIMAQALQTEDGSLPQGLTIQNTYTELQQGSKKAVVVVRNSMAYLQTLQKKAPVARAVLLTLLPESPVAAQLQDEENELQDPCAPRLTVRQ